MSTDRHPRSKKSNFANQAEVPHDPMADAAREALEPLNKPSLAERLDALFKDGWRLAKMPIVGKTF
jgi:hypothetical protein